MALKTYTITTNGDSKGNVIQQPFTIEVHNMQYRDSGGGDTGLFLLVCTMNGSGQTCANSDLEGQGYGDDGTTKTYALPAMDSSKIADLVATIEVDLTNAYGGNWS